MECHGGKVAMFYDKKIPKRNCNHTCLGVISLYYALKKYDYYFP